RPSVLLPFARGLSDRASLAHEVHATPFGVDLLLGRCCLAACQLHALRPLLAQTRSGEALPILKKATMPLPPARFSIWSCSASALPKIPSSPAILALWGMCCLSRKLRSRAFCSACRFPPW